MASQTVQSDKGIGIGIVLSLLAGVGAAAMFAAPGQLTKAWGFALAMIAGILAVVAIQTYG